MTMRRQVLVVVCCVLLATACATRSGVRVDPEGQVAIYARNMITASDTVLTTVDALMVQGTLPREQGVRVIQHLRQLGVAGGDLAMALQAVDSARDQAAQHNAFVIVRAVLKTMQRIITETTLPIGSEETRVRIAGLLATVSDLMIDLALLLPAS